jgi:hypothetical protein
MDWKTSLPLLITAIATILGWFVTHQFNAWRDRENKRREQRIQYLVEAFRKLGKASHHPRLHEIADDVQSAVTDIQLFGTEDQIKKVVTFAKDMAEKNSASLDDVLFALRNDLRKELKLPLVTDQIWWLRIEPKLENNSLEQGGRKYTP